MTGLEALRQLMPPTAESDTAVDWNRLSESWGREFPPDYRRFIELYGAGAVEDYLEILGPEARGGEPEPTTDGMLDETANAEHAWTSARKAFEPAGAAPELIAWGVDASADILCWDASEGDPGKWPVLVYNRGDALWRRYDCGMTDFLVRVLGRDFAECPLGDLALWGKRSPTFLNRREERRRRERGLDPWTGEPDPYAGMFDG